MFPVKYSISNVSIVKSVMLYSAQRLRSVSTITKRTLVVITALERPTGRAYIMINKGRSKAVKTTSVLLVIVDTLLNR